MNRIVVDQTTAINTIAKALAEAKRNGCDEIYIRRGIYHEKVKITGSDLKIIGEDRDSTIITYGDYARKIHVDGKEYNTFRTYTMMILGDNITLENVSIINNSGPGSAVGQAVALSVTGDMVTIRHCNITAHQDTLFLGPLPKDLIIRYQDFLPPDELIFPKQHRILISDSQITGDVDFVFGCANAYFKDCEFISHPGNGYVFAPATDPDDFYGFTVVHGTFKGNEDQSRVYLARPWRDYGKLVLIDCLMDEHIVDEGFNHWEGTNRERTCRFLEWGSRYGDHHPYVRAAFAKSLEEHDLDLYDYRKVHLL